MFEGLEKQTRRVNGVDIAYRMGARSAGMAPFAPEALAEYERCLAGTISPKRFLTCC
ncbi:MULTISPECIES: hypothetical protein [Halomonadaceae]|jgi:hypothetical protein|uniref:Uncharacterized protein n=1 Tax=Vreelandella aquamarina TaxID=77097 RepID=A0A6F8SWP3_9GAMM|nr:MULTISPECIES: hypothetical protein [Halomonas]MCF2912887.1 hypothetical protein [Halomonas sp. Cn5-12]BBM05546.1 hypothetical protein HAALTHF_21670n [Halomonas axialensis]BCA92844.1 hypothetical protein HMSLTHF_26190 [Halomonas meridiana]|tara:strand:- start:494 stop:664 length:171 start_codon:yes stop_codon:yes gene_type:complete